MPNFFGNVFPRLAATVLGASLLGPVTAAADDYHSRPIRVIVPFPAGGSFDTIMRRVGAHVSTTLGQPVVIENKGGAGGIIGIDAGAKAAPDGYTVVGIANSYTINPTIRNDLPYRNSDLVPVIHLAASPLVLMASPEISRQVSTVPELLAYARKTGKPLSYGSFGAATTPHLAMEMLRLREHIAATHVPYKGEAQSVADLQASTIDLVFANLPSALPHAKGSRIKLLAMGTDRRSSMLPDLPTVAEQTDIKQFSFDSWWGLMAPAKTPPERIAKLQQAVAAALADPAVAKTLMDAGIEPSRMPPGQFGAFLNDQTRMYADILRDAKIVVKQ